MNRSKLRKKFLKSSNEESERRFNRRRNFCVSLLRKTKKIFLGNYTIELSPTLENIGKLSVLSSWRRLFKKDLLFWTITAKLLAIMGKFTKSFKCADFRKVFHFNRHHIRDPRVKLQTRPSRDGLRKTFSENIQQIYRRSPMPKCDFSKVPK